MYKHANDEVPLKVSCKKYLEDTIFILYLQDTFQKYLAQHWKNAKVCLQNKNSYERLCS